MSTTIETAARLAAQLEDAIEVPGPSNGSKESFPADDEVLYEDESMSSMPDPGAERLTSVSRSIDRKPNGRKGGTQTQTKREPNPQSSAKMNKILPSAEFVKIYKRTFGRNSYIRDFSLKDIQSSRSIEEFIQKHLVPAFGAGDYEVEAYSQNNALVKTVPISVLDPVGGNNGNGQSNSNSHSQTVAQLLDQVRDLTKQVGTQPSMVEKLNELKAMNEMFGDKKGDAGQMMAMMMMMEKQNNSAYQPMIAQMQRTLEELSRPKERPPIQTIPLPPMPDPGPQLDVAKVIEASNQTQTALMSAILPMLAPKEDKSLEKIAAFTAALAPLIAPMLANRGNDQVSAMREEIRDLKAELRSSKNEPTRGIAESLNDMLALNNVMNKLGGGQEESPWVGIIRTAFENLDGLKGLTDEIRGVDQPKQKQVERNVEPQEQQQQKNFPPGFEEKIRSLASAKDAAARIKITMESLYLMSKSGDWQQFVGQLQRLASEGKKDEAMELMLKFFEAMAEKDYLEESVAQLALDDFDEHYEKVVNFLTGGRAPKEKAVLKRKSERSIPAKPPIDGYEQCPECGVEGAINPQIEPFVCVACGEAFEVEQDESDDADEEISQEKSPDEVN